MWQSSLYMKIHIQAAGKTLSKLSVTVDYFRTIVRLLLCYCGSASVIDKLSEHNF